MNPEEMSMVKAALTPVVQDVQDQGNYKDLFTPSSKMETYRFLTARLHSFQGSKSLFSRSHF